MPSTTTATRHTYPHPIATSSSTSSGSSSGSIHHDREHKRDRHRVSFQDQHQPANTAPPPATSDPLESDPEFDTLAVRFLKIKNQPFAVSGTIPMDGKSMSMFFRNKSGHSTAIDFPVDPESPSCPEFNAFALECRIFSEATTSPSHRGHTTRAEALASTPSSTAGRKTSVSLNGSEPALIFPPSQSVTTTFDLASHPVLDMIRDILFPNLPSGHFLVAKRAVVELAFPGSRKRLPTHEESPANKVATLHLTLPVRFRGGTLVVRHPEDVLGIEEKFAGRGGKGPTLEWVAFLADCSTALEPVEKGCKMTMIYNIVLQSNAQGGMPNPVAPVLANHRFLDAMTPLFTKAKHRKLGFYLSGEYHLNPVDSIAGTLIGQLKGSDSILYHAARLYHLKIELRYAGGGYVWPADRTVQLATTSEAASPISSSSEELDTYRRRKLSISSNARELPPMVHPRHSSSSSSSSVYSSSSTLPVNAQNNIKSQVEASGAQHFHVAGISALTAHSRSEQGPVTRLPVPFLSDDSLNRLWVNVLMVIWEP